MIRMHGDQRGFRVAPPQLIRSPGEGGTGTAGLRLEEELLLVEVGKQASGSIGERGTGDDADSLSSHQGFGPIDGFQQKGLLAGQRQELFRAVRHRGGPEARAATSGQDNRESVQRPRHPC